MKTSKTLVALVCCVALLGGFLGFYLPRTVILFPQHYTVVEEYHNTYLVGAGTGETHASQMTMEVHSTIHHYRWIDGEKYLLFSYAHPAALTQLGENFTAAKLTGDTTWNLTDYLQNVTFISMGIDVGLTTSSTILPGEWNRTAGSFEYIAVGQWNYTASFYPSGSGVTNSTGLNVRSGIGTTLSLWAYDTFSDISYTSNDQIDTEWSVDIQYS